MQTTNLAEVVCSQAARRPSEVAYRFFQGSSLIPDTLTFQALWQGAAALAVTLKEKGLGGQRVLLVCKSHKNFVLAFFACMLAGAVAVPTAPPRRKALLGRLQLLATDAQVLAVICDGDEMQGFALDGTPLPQIDLRTGITPEQTALDAQRWTPPALNGNSIAFLQYTSGSTGDPKGVMVSHGNLMCNCEAIRQGMEFTPESSIFTALPLFHDMGLVGGVLESMVVGCVGNIMSPTEFVQYPERWLQIISAFKVSISGGPNFMYELAARNIKPEDLAGCDLSSWKVAFCGAEPIRAATMELFSRQFAPFGLRPEAFYPCYGMAESTLFITGKQIDALPSVCDLVGNSVVGCGEPRHDTGLAVVDPETACRLPECEVGEIWVSGASVALGYWQRPELTQAMFQAKIVGGDGCPHLRTGDLGYLKDGQLYVTGRLKDLIIAYGKKYAPQDLEEEAERSHPALRVGGCAAFAVADGNGDKVVLVCELQREWLRRHAEWPGVAAAVRSAVNAAHGAAVGEVVFLKPGALPRTSSGKVRRSQCKADYLADALDRAQAVAKSDAAAVRDSQDAPDMQNRTQEKRHD